VRSSTDGRPARAHHHGSVVRDYLLLCAVVLGVNLLPAFGPPTWAVLVFFRLQWGLEAVPLVLVGALSAASGRYLLARGTTLFAGRLSERRRASLRAASDALQERRAAALAGLALFALSPVPSAQLFVAAGLLRVRLLPLTAAFFVGRLVSYSLYVGAASLASRQLGSVLVDGMRSPLGIALQVAMLIALAVLLRVDWAARLTRSARSGSRRTTEAPS
jgi:membrane protein YqaA with SNARE-associated domain